ncbi:unnamed protein product [Lathyrus oleraceus]
MGVRHVLGIGTYLGLPFLIGRSKKATFAHVKDRIRKKINSWRGISGNNNRGIMWMSWNKLKGTKNEGGLAF